MREEGSLGKAVSVVVLSEWSHSGHIILRSRCFVMLVRNIGHSFFVWLARSQSALSETGLAIKLRGKLVKVTSPDPNIRM
jgi:hypothetical protein